MRLPFAPLLSPAPKLRGRHRRTRSSLFVALAATLALLLGGATAVAGTLGAPPAFAATAALAVVKTVDKPGPLAPGEEFTYTIEVECQDDNCIDAVLTDVLPAEFSGFTIVNAPRVISSTAQTSMVVGCTGTVTPNCELVVTATDEINVGEVGLNGGDGFTVMYTLKAPQDLTPSWASNGKPVRNTATARASNTNDSSGFADVTVVIPVSVAVAVGKTWQPASQQFKPGEQSTLALSIRNTSNSPADSLILQDPKVAAENETALPASNPFRIVDFAGFGTVTFPQGATQVQIDAYVLDAGVWTWKSGTPAATATLPGVTAGQVAGLRLTFTDAAGAAVIAADGVAGSVQLNVVQRATDRQSGTTLVLGATASNIVTGTVTVPDQDPKTADSSAPYTIAGLDVVVGAAKTISPVDIPAGGSAVGKISGRNDSNGPLASMTVADNTGFFTNQVLFAGFTEAPMWPGGAETASIVWNIDGTAQAPVAFAAGTTPAVPAAGTVTGFSLVFTGQIESGATGGANFDIRATTALVPDKGSSPKALSNTVTVTGVNPAGTTTANAAAPLNAYFPEIHLSMTKKVSPNGAIAIGGTVVVELPTVTSADSRYVQPNRIEVTDAATGKSDDFWKAFTPVAIAPTQVPLGSVLTVLYTVNGTDWLPLTSADATAGALIFSAPIEETLAPTITGLRYIFTDADNYGQATSVSPNTVFEARATLRGTSTPTATDPETATRYENLAVAEASGVIDSVVVESNKPQGEAPAEVVPNPGAGVLYVDKKWRELSGADKPSIVSQSGDSAITRLFWGVPVAGYNSVTITDPATDADSPADTTFQAFDLTSIRPLSGSVLKWDLVSVINLYYEDEGSWHEVQAPSGGWMNGANFEGYTLTPAEVAKVTGVQIVLAPNDAARAASDDPTRPDSGSGIYTGAAGANRYFDLQWSLRNVLRVPDAVDATKRWATGSTDFNLDDSPGAVRNTLAVSGSRYDFGAVIGGMAHDDITLLDFAPNVKVTMDVSQDTVVIPNPGDVDPAAYPFIDLTLTAQSTSVPRASYLRVTTPECGTNMNAACLSDALGSGENPFTGAEYSTSSPFERVSLTGLAFTVPSAQVSKDHSMVTLWFRADDGTLSTQTFTITEAEALSAAELAEVVGVSVVYQGTNPETDGGSIVSGSALAMVMTTQLRPTLRSGGVSDFVIRTQVNGLGAAQSYDPVLYPTGPLSMPGASAPGDFALVDGVLDATASKIFTPSLVLERDRAAEVQVRLNATDGASTAPTHRVTLTDTDARFWDAAALVGLGTVTLPAGADQVRVDVQTGSSTWILGTAGATAVLPTVNPAEVTGIRFLFDRADGGLFSTSAIPADWSATALMTVKLRDHLISNDQAVTFPRNVPNILQVGSARTDDPKIFDSATAQSADSLSLDTGTFALDVVKSPAGNIHTVGPGEEVAWTLAFRNTGTGFLTVSELVDTLPAHLKFTLDEPVYSTSTGGTLSSEVGMVFDQPSGELRFDWPSGGQRMSPGETFTIVLKTTLEPGAPTPTTNRFVVTVDQTLGACTNASTNGQGVIANMAATECGTTNFVEPIQGASIASYKGVKGEIDGTLVDGAVNVSNPSRVCLPDAEGYFRSPCAANTVVGATDEWSLRTMNSGTEPLKSLVLVEPLPVAGDRMLATGGARGSTWRPIFDEAFGLDTSGMPASTAVSWEVSTDASLCTGTAGTSTWQADSTCAGNTWTAATAFAGDWAQVTGLRILLDFGGTALQPGEAATVLFRTINQPVTATDASLAPVTVPASDHYAWNQFGATATFVSNETMRRAPVKAGVALATGSLEVVKEITGDAAAFAPDEFLVDVVCTIAGTPLGLGQFAQLTLDDAASYRARVDGIPLGAECSVTEVGAIGEFDETARSGDGATVSITVPGASGAAVPAAQSVTIGNDYDWGQLTITKNEDRAFAAIGETVTYTITVANIGARTAFDRVVTDTLPEHARLISTSPVAVELDGVLSWEVAELAPGESVSLSVMVNYSVAGHHINRASVTNPPGPWEPVVPVKPCLDDPESACTNVTVNELTVTGAARVDAILLGAALLLLIGLLAVWAARRSQTVG